MSKRSTEKLMEQVQELESNISRFDIVQETVSKAPIGWHLEHMMLVINGVIGTLATSEPEQFRSKFNLKKFIIFILGKFPKGKARAPKSVRPTDDISEAELQNHLEKTKHQSAKLPSLPPKAHFKHPLFGELDLNDSIRFLEMHTEHHLKIVRAINRADQ